MKTIFRPANVVCLGAVAWLCLSVSVEASRPQPRPVKPVLHHGINYTAPNDKGRVGYVEAWDHQHGRKLWEQTVFTLILNPTVEEDVQWVFITALEIQGDNLVIQTEDRQTYSLDLRTRKVTALKLRPSARTAPAVFAAGEWSEAARELRARLLFNEGARINQTRTGMIYLELQNVSAKGSPLELYYHTLSAFGSCDLTDAAGRSLAPPGHPLASSTIPLPYWLSIPSDFTVCHRVNPNDEKPPQDAGWMISIPGHIGKGCFWIIPPDAQGEYALSGAFKVIAPPNHGRTHVWEGTLKVPPVRFSAKHPQPTS